MRRKDREVTGRERIEPILKACRVCRLAMLADGRPYVVPLNFGYEWDETGLTLYFHSGRAGRKIDALRADPRVCFELDREDGLIDGGETACRYGCAFRSVIGEGTARFARDGREKRRGLDALMRHMTGRDGWTYSDAQLAAVEVLCVRADSLSASVKPAAGPPG